MRSTLFLGHRSSKRKGCLTLVSGKYALEILERVGMQNCKPPPTPLSTTKKLSKFEGEALSAEDNTRYRSIIGALQYLTLTHHDLAFSVNKVC